MTAPPLDHEAAKDWARRVIVWTKGRTGDRRNAAQCYLDAIARAEASSKYAAEVVRALSAARARAEKAERENAELRESLRVADVRLVERLL